MAEALETKIAVIETDLKNVEGRVSVLEEVSKERHELAKSVQKLAINMEYMLQEQREIKTKVQALETAPAEEHKFFRREVIKCIISGVLGAIIAALVALVIK